MGEEAVSHIETRLGGMEDAETEEVKLSLSIHLPFQTFEPIDLAFDLPLAPGQGTRRINGRVILLHALGETFEFGDLTAVGFSDPILQLVRSAFFEHAQEVLTELIGAGQIPTSLTQLLELPLLLRSELFFGKHKEKGGLVGRKAAGAWEQSQESGEVIPCWLEGQEEAAGATAW
jgi:hypothetical protein